MMSARRLARSSSGRRSASSSTWMLARRLAIGVRSSWLASATRWRCASADCSSASSVALKLRAEARELVLALDLQPLRQVGIRGQRLGLAREARDRAPAPRAPRCRRAPPRRGCRRRRRRAGSAAAGASTGRPRSAGARPAPRRGHRDPTVSTRRCTPCDAHVGEVAAGTARPRVASCALSTGNCVAAVVAERIVPCGETYCTLPAASPNGFGGRCRDRRRRPSGLPRRRRRAAAAGSSAAERARAAPGRSARAASSASPRTAWRRAR